ncbi:glyceraldehyde 3-phosphate dehydrogenase NAD-binding domain-containing protein [Alisedimentitalea sp. MJ-SS2]|uniref:type I glyceraldehyde-3-phosphate dehydrogenase n=1 Tax=Aliisedimentitalea sp. MJ-SS2 TaxID=3049795 RepID=UPI00290F1D9B|nr:glyceraldehyde 3-phosphate dehydrogenase NAD-binding domain-containing protein [Alisedimentitalea sp. MJ-SS2]MDU8929483.1 glyceraldehyde 3-phosphate dehydrogenase NAD-binding domain-containing protein [Alisedimentitalea sp. MJ-SS2]
MADQPIRIAINGFGRIGRSILRMLMGTRGSEGFELVAINDIAALESCAYLFAYDSVFGPYPGKVSHEDAVLIVDGVRIPFFRADDIREVELAGVDVLLECTGAAGNRADVERGLEAGARKVLISGPSEVADLTVVLGANEGDLGDHRVVSNASCTTNALAPLAGLLDAHWGVESGHMTTVHCYTGSQPTIDKPRDNLVRSRAAALSMVPTTTSAAHLIGEVLPGMAGRIEARAVRVPTASVSAIDLTVQTRAPVSVAAVNTVLQQAAAESGVFGWITMPLVSTDLRMRPESIVMSGRETSVSVGGLLRVFGWYDNEWGFSNRMLDVARLMA